MNESPSREISSLRYGKSGRLLTEDETTASAKRGIELSTMIEYVV